MTVKQVKVASCVSFSLNTQLECVQTFPGVTPFDALVYGIAAISKTLPPGSPATLHCINLLVHKASTLKPMSTSVKDVKKGAEKDLDDLGDAEKLQLLLLHLIGRVDLQVCPSAELCADIADLFQIQKNICMLIVGLSLTAFFHMLTGSPGAAEANGTLDSWSTSSGTHSST